MILWKSLASRRKGQRCYSTMQIGQKIISQTYPGKGIGIILQIQEIFGTQYAEIHFRQTGETISLPVSDLALIQSPTELYEQKHLSTPSAFYARLLAYQLQSLLSQSGIITAHQFKIIPLPHQLLTVDFVLNQFKPRCLIADEVGLGKTIEAAMVYEELKLRKMVKRILIITPAGLTAQWRDEMKVKFNEDFAIYDSQVFSGLRQLYGEATNLWKIHDKIITSLDFVKPRAVRQMQEQNELQRRSWHNRRIFEDMVQAGWDMAIFDEAHKLSKDSEQAETARYKVGKAFSEAVPVLLFLSATPHQGDPIRFLNLLNLLDPYLFYRSEDLTPANIQQISYRNRKRAAVDFNGKRLFKKRFTTMCKIKRDQSQYQIELDLYQAVSGYVSEFYNLAVQARNYTMIFLLMLYQRMVSSSSKAIFDSLLKRLGFLEGIQKQIEQIESLTQSETNGEDFRDYDTQSLYEMISQLAVFMRSPALLQQEIQIVQHCLGLARRATISRTDAKLNQLLLICDEIRRRENNPHTKFLVFTEFIATQHYISEALKALGYQAELIHGKMNLDERVTAKEKFKTSSDFLISTDAGGEGINLQFCHIVINYDMPWNPMKLEQRIGRVDRIGQEKDALVFNFQLIDTIEERVRTRLEEKLEVIKNQYGEDKFADILNSLEDEFDFDNIYLNLMSLKENQNEELEKLASSIYESALKILERDELLLPFNELKTEQVESYKNRARDQFKVQKFIENLVAHFSKSMEPFKSNPRIYHFENPFVENESFTNIKKVTFNQEEAIEDENLHLLSLTHPFVEYAINKIIDDPLNGKTATIKIIHQQLLKQSGFLFIFRLNLTNNQDLNQRKVFPIYIDEQGNYNFRLTQFFQQNDSFHSLPTNSMANLNDAIKDMALKKAQEVAETLFYETKQELLEKIKKEKDRIGKYQQDKRQAIQRIAIVNILESKLKELEQEIQKNIQELNQRSLLIPKLTLEQVAYVGIN